MASSIEGAHPQPRPKDAASPSIPCCDRMSKAMPAERSRTASLLAGVAQWRDPNSQVRSGARVAFRDGEWPAEVVETALDRALDDADRVIEAFECSPQAAAKTTGDPAGSKR